MTDASNEPTAEATSAANAASALCENCKRPRAERFCSQCGQNDRSYSRSLFPVLGELVRESFEFDGRLAQTLRLLLLKPGSLSTEFSQNRRARYMTPVRLYLFTSVIFFLTMSLAMSRVPNPLEEEPAQDPSSALAEIPGDVMDSLQAVVPGLQLQVDGEDVPVSMDISESGIAALRANLELSQHGKLDDLLKRESARATQVVLAVLAAAFDPEAGSAAQDTLAEPRDGTVTGDPPPGDTVVLPTSRGFLARMFLNSIVDLMHDPDAFTERIIGNLSIAMFFLLPVYALMLAVLYWRTKRYYIEHLVFGMHVHSFLFMIVTLMLIASITPMGATGQGWTRGILGLVVVAYPIIALRRFYGNGWLITLVKAFVLGILYFTIVSPLNDRKSPDYDRPVPDRLTMLPRLALVALLSMASACGPPRSATDTDFEVAEATISALQDAMAAGRVTSVQLVDSYLARIAAYDRMGPALNTIIRLNPLARDQAAALDAARSAGTVRGPLHGIPVLMKDNYDMDWMPTTGSSLALAALQPVDNAFQVERLLDAGAVILGKTNLHELAAGITTISSLGGQTRNPYDPVRNPGGSSGGTGAAVAASFAAVAWGSDTCGSIRIPAAVHNLFGLRPTKGLSSIDGILPLSHSQDTGGPLARTVTDLAIALDATVGRDPADPATAILEGRETPGFRAALDPAALEGARIGVLEAWVPEQGSAGSVTGVIRNALAEMATLGATILDVEIPDMDDLLSNTGLIDFEFKFDLMDYLASIPDAPVSSLEEILEAGLHHEALDGNFRRRNERAARESSELDETMERRRALTAAVVDLLTRHDLDALAYPTMRQETALIGAAPTGATCFLSAHTGLPALTIPAGFTERGLPVGLELLGRPLDDARLVAFAFAYESAAPKRRPPLRTPPLVNGTAPPPVRIVTDPPSGEGVDAVLGVDLPTGTLSYRIIISSAAPADVYGTVLRRRAATRRPAPAEEPDEETNEEADGGDGAMVVLRLGGPAEADMRGTVALSPRLLHDIMDGNLELVTYTSAGLDHRRLAPRTRP